MSSLTASKRVRCPRGCGGYMSMRNESNVCGKCFYSEEPEFEHEAERFTQLATQETVERERDKRLLSQFDPSRRRMKYIEKVMFSQLNFVQERLFDGVHPPEVFERFESTCFDLYERLKGKSEKLPTWTCIILFYFSFFSVGMPVFISDICLWIQCGLLPYDTEWKNVYKSFIEDINKKEKGTSSKKKMTDEDDDHEEKEEIENVSTDINKIPKDTRMIWRMGSLRFLQHHNHIRRIGFQIEYFIASFLDRLFGHSVSKNQKKENGNGSEENVVDQVTVYKTFLFEQISEIYRIVGFRNPLIIPSRFESGPENEMTLELDPPEIVLIPYILSSFHLLFSMSSPSKAKKVDDTMMNDEDEEAEDDDEVEDRNAEFREVMGYIFRNLEIQKSHLRISTSLSHETVIPVPNNVHPKMDFLEIDMDYDLDLIVTSQYTQKRYIPCYKNIESQTSLLFNKDNNNNRMNDEEDEEDEGEDDDDDEKEQQQQQSIITSTTNKKLWKYEPFHKKRYQVKGNVRSLPRRNLQDLQETSKDFMIHEEELTPRCSVHTNSSSQTPIQHFLLLDQMDDSNDDSNMNDDDDDDDESYFNYYYWWMDKNRMNMRIKKESSLYKKLNQIKQENLSTQILIKQHYLEAEYIKRIASDSDDDDDNDDSVSVTLKKREKEERRMWYVLFILLQKHCGMLRKPARFGMKHLNNLSGKKIRKKMKKIIGRWKKPTTRKNDDDDDDDDDNIIIDDHKDEDEEGVTSDADTD